MPQPHDPSLTAVQPTGCDPPTDDSRWFYRHRGKMYGPVSATDLRAAAHLGFLKPRDAVLRHGETAWLQARLIPWLFTTRANSMRS